MDRFTDSIRLKTTQYRDASNLDARIALHRDFSTNSQDFHRWYFDQMTVPAAAHVLELGCGSGALWLANADRIPQGWEITMTDLSPGMLADAERKLQAVPHAFRFREADIQAIPFADGSFDVLLANHMLYHVPDRPRALAEIRRVLRPGGRFYAATNGEGHMRELRELAHAVADAMPVERSLGFTLETGAHELAPFFQHVVLRRFPNDLLVTEAEPLKAFVRSLYREYDLSDDELSAVETHIDEEMAERGSIFIHKSVGMFEAW
jgi:ubiquinone/menaquinone biosynthesis C-methylase UbiE